MVAALLILAFGTLTFAMLRSAPPPAPAAAPVTAPTPATKPAPAAVSAPVAPSTTPTTPAAASASVPSKWKAANAEWLLNAKRGVAFELASSNRVSVWQGVTQPMLVVRCDAGRVQTFVYTASAIQMEAVDENHTVRLSFDGEPEATERWADSAEHDALFAPNGLAFAQRVSTAQSLRFSYTPHNAPRVTAEFHTSGLGEHLTRAAKPCGVR